MKSRVLYLLVGFWVSALYVLAQSGPDSDPDGAQGYVNNIFHHSQVDSINLYNGQLTIPLAIGPSYPIGPKLKFQAMLTYNSRVWEYGRPNVINPPAKYLPLSGDPALGIGWDFTLGAIKSCREGSSLSPCYIGPDGSQHVFNSSPSPGFSKTSDASQLYLHDMGNGGPFEMWDEDGNRHVFSWQVVGFDDPPTDFSHDFGRGRDGWYLTSLSDAFGNSLSVTYRTFTSPCWTYPPSSCVPRMLCPLPSNSWIPQMINVPTGTVTISTNGDQMISSFTFPVLVNGTATTATYSILYQTEVYNEPPICGVGVPVQVNLREIAAVQLPSGIGSYQFGYSQGCASGLLTRMTVPTGATIDYAYAYYVFYHARLAALSPSCQFSNTPPSGAVVQVTGSDLCGGLSPAPAGPAPLRPIGDGCDPTDEGRYLDQQAGVVRRTETVGGVPQTTNYTQYAFPFGEQGSFSNNLGSQTLTVILFPPAVDGKRRAKAALFWSTQPGGVPPQPLAGDRVGADLEERVFDGDPNPTGPGLIPIPSCGGASNQTFCPNFAVRDAQRGYEYDDNVNLKGNRRLTSETTYHGPTQANGSCPGCPAHAVSFSNLFGRTWEGNGRHYNIEGHSGTLGNDSRTITTNWTPQVTPWLPNLYDRRTESDATTATTVDRYFEFTPTTGFARGEFIFDSPRQRVFLRCRYPDGQGNVYQEFTATYDGITTTPPSNACSFSYPNFPTIGVGLNSDAFGKIHSYQNGLRLTTRWMMNPTTPASWFSLNLTRDPTTGWITSSSDTAGVPTSYLYDSLGRVTQISPQFEAVTAVSYPSTVQTVATRDGGPGLSTTQTYDYDGLGRLIRERRLMPDGTYAKRFTRFDSAGNDYFKSEWVSDGTSEALSADLSTTCAFSNGPYSTFRPSAAPGSYQLCFDPFRRPQQVVGSMHSSLSTINRTDGSVPYSDTLEAITTWCVDGTRSGSTCSGGVTPDPVTTTRRDAFGRATSVIEPDGVLTSYTYHVSGKLTSVSQLPNQTRTFEYDPAGFLRSEITPERGTITYSNYGSLGNAFCYFDGTNSIGTLYDGAGRVTQSGTISTPCASWDRSSWSPLYLSSAYDSPGYGSSGGKLTQRIGYNPVSPGQPTVVENFFYFGLGGRLSQKDMTVSGTPLPLGTVSQTWSYNLLGLLNSYSPPRRSGDPDLTATLSYSNGLPVGLSVGAQSLVSGTTYQPHGGLASWTAGNSVTTTIQQDPSLLPRPLQISAGSFNTGAYAYDGVGNVKAMGLDSFSYDPLSRLTSSTVSGQPLSYGYDRYGNLNPSAINPVNNRLSAGTYDARGNLTEYLGQRYDYDGLSRQTALNRGYERYLYDGAGERIARLTSPTPGADFYTITACRLLDTRPVPLSPAVARVIQVAGNCGVPAEATGVFGNLTAVSPSAEGLLNLFPTGTNPQTSSLNYRTGLTRANNFALGLSANGQLTLITSAATDALLDLSGYMRFPDPTWTVTFRDESSRLSTDYTVTSSAITRTRSYFYFGNQLAATRDAGGTYLYYAGDHLGSPRQVTNQFGSVVETHTYHPFGQEITGVFGNQPIKFAAMERDLSSLNDYDHARYCSPLTGRFLSPDKVGGKSLNPQTWNRYAYARNNPLKLVDPNGLVEVTFQVVTYIAAPVAQPSIFGIGIGPTFRGDNRNFNSRQDHFRTFQRVTVETDPRRGPALVGPPVLKTGISENLSTGAKGQASTSGLRVGDPIRTLNGVSFTLTGKAADPVASFAPSVDYKLNITVNAAGDQFSVTGTREGYPSYLGTATNAAGQTVTFLNSSEDTALFNAFSMIDLFGDRPEVNERCGFGDKAGCNVPGPK